MRVRSILAVCSAALVLLSACGLWTKQHQAEAIYRSRELGHKAKTASGVLHLIYIPAPSEEGEEQAPPGVQGIPSTISAKADFHLNFENESARLTMEDIALPLEGEDAIDAGAATPPVEGLPAPAPPTTQPAAAPAANEAGTVFHGGTVFVRRANLRSAGRRVWAKLDFDKLDDDEPRPSSDSMEGARYVIATFNTVNPAYLFDLVLGALPGSVEIGGKEMIGGVQTTKYSTNVSIERSINELDLDDEELETRILMFNLLGVFEDARPGAFWLDDSGMVKRIRVHFTQAVSRTERNNLIVTLDVSSYGEPVEVPRPTGDETVEVERYARLIRVAAP